MRVYVSICAYQTLRSSKAAVDCMEDFPPECTIHHRPQFWCTRFTLVCSALLAVSRFAEIRRPSLDEGYAKIVYGTRTTS